MHARDPAELYKDKIEVSLDGRQIFYLFFGGAVVVGMVFVLGVLVGRRVEARGHVDLARAAAGADPLAALDRLEGPEHLSFKGALTGAEAPTEVERAVGELEKARGGKVEPAPAPKAEKRAAEPKLEKKPEKAERAEKAEPKAEKAEPKAEKAERAEKPERARSAEKPERDARDAKDTHDAKDSHDAKESRKKRKADGESADAGSTRFTLQLSSFQDRQEADTFVATLKAAGYQPYLTEADVGGKGTFYRVRIGAYRSADAANDARPDLERITKKSASVMRL